MRPPTAAGGHSTVPPAGRGLGEATLERFGLGWAPPGWSNLLDAAGKRYAPSLLERAGLVVANDRGGHYDRFRGRVVLVLPERGQPQWIEGVVEIVSE